MRRPGFGFEPDPRAFALCLPPDLSPPFHAYASLLLYQIKAKIVTKIKACISVLKCTEEVALLKEEGCGDEENYVCQIPAAPPIRPRLNSDHKSKAFKKLLFSFVDLSVSRTTKTYKTVKYKTSTFWLVWLLPFSCIILKRRQTCLHTHTHIHHQAEAYQTVSQSLNLLTFCLFHFQSNLSLLS